MHGLTVNIQIWSWPISKAIKNKSMIQGFFRRRKTRWSFFAGYSWDFYHDSRLMVLWGLILLCITTIFSWSTMFMILLWCCYKQWDDGYSGLSDILSSTRNRKFRDAVLENGDWILHTAILSGKGWQTWQTIELWGTHILFIQTHIAGPSVPHFPNQFFLFWSYSPSLVAGHIQVVQACMNVMAMRPLARNAERNRNVLECRNVLQKCFKKKLLVVGILGVLVPWTGSTWSWSKETTSQSSGSWRCSTTCFEKTAVVALCHGFRWVSTGHPCLKTFGSAAQWPNGCGPSEACSK